MKDYYKILQVDKEASPEFIKKAFNYHIKKNHPDISNDKESAKERTQEINEAYSILSNVEKRKFYDNKLKEEENLKLSKDLEINDKLEYENQLLKEELDKKDKIIEGICKEINIDKSYFINTEDKSNEDTDINMYSYKLKRFIIKTIVILILTIIIFIMVSVLTKTNVFALFIDAFFK